MIDLFDAAVDGAIEGERGQAADGDLLRRVPGGRERPRADADRISGTGGEARRFRRDVDRSGFGECSMNVRCRSALQPPVLRLGCGVNGTAGLSPDADESTGISTAGTVTSSGNKSIGTLVGSGTKVTRGPPSSSVAASVSSTSLCACDHLSNSSTVQSRLKRRAMIHLHAE
jgi:hypothetical protein